MTEDWAEIRRLHKSEKLSIQAIVRRTGLAGNTVRAALASDAHRAAQSRLIASVMLLEVFLAGEGRGPDPGGGQGRVAAGAMIVLTMLM